MAIIHERLANLAVPERTRLLRLLELEELAVGEIARVVQMPQSTVSRHLKALEDDGWVVARRDGTARLFALRDDLAPAERALWDVVRAATDGDHAEDGLRLASVLAARSGDARRFFGQVAERWTELRRELFGESYLLPAALALLPHRWTLADLGCGTGDLLVALAPWVRRVIGVDREPAMLAIARERTAGLAPVEVREGSLEDPPLAPGEVDAAFLTLVLHHVELPTVVLGAIRPCLAPGGRLVVVDMLAHDRESYRRTMGHVHLGFSRDEIEQVAAASGLVLDRWVVLPPDVAASGPPLFLAVLVAAGQAA